MCKKKIGLWRSENVNSLTAGFTIDSTIPETSGDRFLVIDAQLSCCLCFLDSISLQHYHICYAICISRNLFMYSCYRCTIKTQMLIGNFFLLGLL